MYVQYKYLYHNTMYVCLFLLISYVYHSIWKVNLEDTKSLEPPNTFSFLQQLRHDLAHKIHF